MEKEPQMTIRTGGGRMLGTYAGTTAEEAATNYAIANEYASISAAEEGRLFAFSTLVFTPEEETN